MQTIALLSRGAAGKQLVLGNDIKCEYVLIGLSIHSARLRSPAWTVISERENPFTIYCFTKSIIVLLKIYHSATKYPSG